MKVGLLAGLAALAAILGRATEELEKEQVDAHQARLDELKKLQAFSDSCRALREKGLGY